jgi:hypothetical protein
MWHNVLLDVANCARCDTVTTHSAEAWRVERAMVGQHAMAAQTCDGGELSRRADITRDIIKLLFSLGRGGAEAHEGTNHEGAFTLRRSRTPPCWTGLRVESREIGGKPSCSHTEWALSGSAARPELDPAVHVSAARSMQSQAGVRSVAPRNGTLNTLAGRT